MDEALDRLLGGTGLIFGYIDENTIAIMPHGDSTTPNGANLISFQDSTRQQAAGANQYDSGEGAQKKSFWGRFRLAQASEQAESNGNVIRLAPSGDSEKKIMELEEVVVTGTHIRGSQPVGSKVIVIDREDIERSGYGRVQDLLETLPQNFASISEDFSGPSNPTQGTEVQLRGLGSGTTLTLINGHRQPTGGTLSAFVDISSIPSSAIERIEILPDGASAIYGSDAIGGVVNIILRKDYEGAETWVRGGSAEGDKDEVQLAQLLGHRWASGNALIGYQYTKQDSLRYGSRDYLATGGDQRRFGGSDWRREGVAPTLAPSCVRPQAHSAAHRISRPMRFHTDKTGQI